MADYNNLYKTKIAEGQKGRIEQLLQLLRVVYDGDLIDKGEREMLVKKGLAQKCDGGYNLITSKGLTYLEDLGLIHP